MGTNDIKELLNLAASERLAIAEQLFASVVREAENAPLTSTEQAFVAQRLEEHQAFPKDVVDWPEVKKTLGL